MFRKFGSFGYLSEPLFGALGGAVAILIDYCLSADGAMIVLIVDSLTSTIAGDFHMEAARRMAAFSLLVVSAAAGVVVSAKGLVARFVCGFAALSIANLLLPAIL